jgi:hypothetical protein
MSAFWADATTMAQLVAATTESARRSIADSRLGDGTLTVELIDGSAATKFSGTFSGSLFVAASAAMTDVELAAETGDGGTPDSTWTLKISNAGGAYLQFPKAAWTYSGDGGSPVVDSGDNTFVSLTLGEVSYVPGTPPAAVTTWITQSNVAVPADFMGIHSDYVDGATYPVEPTFMSSIGTVRSLDHDPDRGWTTRLCWAAIEQTAGVYTWTYLDAWVAEHTGKTLIYVIERCPAFYKKYTNSTSYDLYPSFPSSSSPPSDWTKAVDLCTAIKARYPSETILFELWNEPNFGWYDGAGGAITAGNMYTTRMTDAFIAYAGVGSVFFTGTAVDLADGAKALYNAGIRPLIVGSWEGQTTDSLVNCFRRFSNAPCTGGGTGKDFIDYWSFHSYTYNGDGRKLINEGINYKALASTLGVTQPYMLTEIGHESPTLANTLGDTAHATNVIRWTYIAAALGCKALHLYNLDSGAPSGGSADARYLKYYSTTETTPKANANAATSAAIVTASAVAGKNIGQAAQLSDGSIWVEFTDNTSVRR